MNILIPLAGKGERFRKEGYKAPKCVIPVLGKPMIFHVLDNIQMEKEDTLFVFYNYELDAWNLKDTLTQRYPGVQCFSVPNTRGAAETLRLGIEQMDSKYKDRPCVVMDCDTFYTHNVLAEIRSSVFKNSVFYTYNKDPNPLYSYIQKGLDNRIEVIREKEKISDFANTGIYCFAQTQQLSEGCNDIIRRDIRFRDEFYTSCVISELIKSGYDFYAIGIPGDTVFSLGTPQQVSNYLGRTYGFLFDLDGTLVKTDAIYFNVWKQILEQYNIHITSELFDTYIRGHSDSHVQQTLLPHVDVSQISAQKDTLFLESIDKLEEVTGATEFVKSVHKQGHPIVIVTNCNRLIAEAILSRIHLQQYISTVIIGEECDRPKPYSDPYKVAMKSLHLTPEKCLIFEDSKTGLLSATSIQPKCVIGLQTYYTSKDLKESGADITCSDFRNIQLSTLLTFTKDTLHALSHPVKEAFQRIHHIVTDINWDTNKLKGGYISDVLSATVIVENARHPISCVLKLENQNDSYLSRMANKLGLYEREYYFYETISKYVNVGIPKFYGLVKSPSFRNMGILLENLNPTCHLALNLNKESVNVSLTVIDACAKLHAKFWNKDLCSAFPFLKKNNDSLFQPSWGNYVSDQWPAFKSRWSFLLTQEQLQFCENIVSDFSNIQNSLSNNNLTLVHGDVKSGNIFYRKTDNEPFFLDWQYVAIGKGVQDLVFFMIESFDIHIMKKYFLLFKQYYYIKLLENGVNEYSIDEYEKDFVNAVKYYPFFVAIWFGTTPEDDLIDKNFPFFFIQKYIAFLTLHLQ
jgi:HAD superfamily hydrolase (TIGR01509 family)